MSTTTTSRHSKPYKKSHSSSKSNDPTTQDASPSLPFAPIIVVLPFEIQSSILHHTLISSPRQQLKLFRFSRATHPIATALLFDTLHLSASKRSFERLEHIAQSQTLSRYVRMLVFHRGTWAGHSMSRSMLRPKDMDEFTNAILKRRAQSQAQSQQETQLAQQMSTLRLNTDDCVQHDLKQSYSNFTDALNQERLFEREIDLRRLLTRLVALLPNLSGVSVPMKSDLHDDVSEYFERNIGLQQQSWTKNYFAPHEIVQAVVQPMSGLGGRTSKAVEGGVSSVGCGLRDLRLEGVNFADFSEIFMNKSLYRPHTREDAWTQCFGRLQSFSFYPADVVDGEWRSRYEEFESAWPAFLGTFSQNLRELRLDTSLCGVHNTGSSSSLLSITHLIANGFLKQPETKWFSKLRTLQLVDVQMCEDDFVAFLEGAWASLESLELHGWQIPVFRMGNYGVKEPQGSILSAFKRIGMLHEHMRTQDGIPSRLRCVSLQGDFSNRIDFEGWRASPDPDHDDHGPGHGLSIRRRFELYMLGQLSAKDFPVPRASLQFITDAQWSQSSVMANGKDYLWDSTENEQTVQIGQDVDLNCWVLNQEDQDMMGQDRSWKWMEFASGA